MLMKISLALGQPRPLSRSEVWGCFTANLALPGAGSLVAGRRVGYVQMAVYLFGFIISLIGAVGFIKWYLASQSQTNRAGDLDPFAALGALWHAARLPLAGLGVFIFALSWATLTSLQIMRANPGASAPPKIAPGR